MKQSGEGRDRTSIADLLEELDQLRELDQQRHTHAPGSHDHDRMTRDLEYRTRRLMDRFRDLKLPRPAGGPRTVISEPTVAPDVTILQVARPADRATIGATRTG